MKNQIAGQELAFHWFEYRAAQIKLSHKAPGPGIYGPVSMKRSAQIEDYFERKK
jgi:hypothetical protein